MFAGTPLSTLVTMSNTYIQIDTTIPPYNSGNVIVNVAPMDTGVNIQIKDIGGDPFYYSYFMNSIIVSTTTGSFTDGTTSKSITTPYGSINLVASTNTWAPVFNEVITSSVLQTVSTLYVSTNITSSNYLVNASTIVYGDIQTIGSIEISGTLMLGPYSTFTVSTMSNTFYNLQTTSSYVSSSTFYSTMSNLGMSAPDPYISTSTLEYVYKNLGTNYKYISTAQMVKDLGVLSSIYISSLSQLNPQLITTSSLVYNSTGMMTTGTQNTVNKWYGVRSQAIIGNFIFHFMLLDIVYDSGGILYLLSSTTLYSYNTTSHIATVMYSGFNGALAMAFDTTFTNIYVCTSNYIYKVIKSSPSAAPATVTSYISATYGASIFYSAGNLYVFKNIPGSSGNLFVYTIGGVYVTQYNGPLDINEPCTGVAVYGNTIYISSPTVIRVYRINSLGNYSLDFYTYSGPIQDGYLTFTYYDNIPSSGQPYISPIARTQSIKSLKLDSITNTVYFTDGNKIRKLTVRPSVPVTNHSSPTISGYYVETIAGTGAAGILDGLGTTTATLDYSRGGPLALYGGWTAAATSTWTYDNINQIFRYFTISNNIVTTDYVSQVTSSPVVKIVDIVYLNGNLYMLTPQTLQVYSLTTNTLTPFRYLNFTNAMSLTCDGTYFYVCDYSSLIGSTFSQIWKIPLSGLTQTEIFNTGSIAPGLQIVTSYLYSGSLYFVYKNGAVQTLSSVNLVTGVRTVSPISITGAQVNSLIVTPTNTFIGSVSGVIYIYSTTSLYINTLSGFTQDGYIRAGFCSVFTNVLSMKFDTLTQSIYFTDTNCIRKFTWNSTTQTGNILTIAGTGVTGTLNGDGEVATLNFTLGGPLAVNNGILYAVDNTANICRIISPVTGNDRLQVSYVNCTGTTTVQASTIATYFGYDSGGMVMSSDIRLKDSIQPLTSSLEKISRLQGVRYIKIGEQKERIGCIAQDVEVEYPEVVEMGFDGYKRIYYDELTSPLVESVKELTTRIRLLQSTLEPRFSRS